MKRLLIRSCLIAGLVCAASCASNLSLIHI